ncbi:B-cell antigen receptor complex-associated protein beta chain-like [Amblyraja radiata]|uniref:B-cell antigen receptor complex-associated protein beta chain-like n=1 Tax=Amblyraja radiata TaxID=386614 RepID=UPI0014031F60|nr:B-cell antigen receptor complex-associated protein beta chain-like [Amblyraja radiata]
MAFFTGKSCPVLNILIFMLTFTSWILGVFCGEQKVSYSEPYRAVIKGNNVTLRCTFDNLPDNATCQIKWYKDGQTTTELKGTTNNNCVAWLRIFNAKKFNSGIYYCKLQTDTKSIVQCAAEVSVQPKITEVNKMKTATTMKDMLILIQGILLMLCLTLPGMLFLNKDNQTKNDNDENEAYHMYEGLEVMQTAMYEDIGNMRPTEDKCATAEQPNE